MLKYIHTTQTQTQKKLQKNAVFASPHTFDDHNTIITCFFKKQKAEFKNSILDVLLMLLLFDDISSSYKGYQGGQLAGYLELVSRISSYINCNNSIVLPLIANLCKHTNTKARMQISIAVM